MTYGPRFFPLFAVTVDIAVLSAKANLSVLLIRRGENPFARELALPGGFVLADESVDDAARRELGEETGLDSVTAVGVHLEQLGTFGAVDRDPRMRVVSVAYLALVSSRPALKAGTDAADAMWVPVDDALAGPLAFDHGDILSTAVERAGAKLGYTTLATELAGAEFTLADLHHIYETVWSTRLDLGNFRRKVLASDGFVAPIGERRQSSRGGPPAAVYRAGSARLVMPPLLRHRGSSAIET